MSWHKKAIILATFLALVFLAGPTLGAVAPPALTISQLVTSGQTVTLQAPAGDYFYQWSAEVGGSSIGSATTQKFSFTAPLVSQEEGSKTVTIYLFIRTKEEGCVNQSTTDLNVYSLPVCGIGGPGQVGPYDRATYTYTGGTTGQLTFEWTVDGKKIDGATGPNVDIDWSQYDVVNHTIGMTLTRDYSDVAPGSTNPFRSISCTYKTNVTYTPKMELVKVASPTTAAVGETVTYTYTVRNTGTIGINSLALKDDKLGTISLSPTTIMPGDQATATTTYTIKENDLPGPLKNNATVSGAEDRTKKPISAAANATVALTYTATLAMTKIPSANTAAVGETVTYAYTIRNTGLVTIKALALNDDKLGAIRLNKTELAPGGVASGTATHVVLESDLPGPITNTATVTGTDSQNKPVTTTATATVALTYTSSLAVTKTPSANTAAVGETVNYAFTVANTGKVTVNGLTLNDDKLGAITLDKTSLAPGDTATGTASHLVVEADLPGPITNTATAAGTDSQNGAVTAQATATVALTYTATMEVVKTSSSPTAAVGGSITYTYNVRNTGTVTLKGLKLVDDKLKAITVDKDTLAPGDTATGTVSYTTLETDQPGPLTNVVTVTATDSAGKPVTSTATATVTLTYASGMYITKTPSTNTVAVGDTVTYSYRVVNTGKVTINTLALSDDKLGAIRMDKTTLAPGEAATGTASYTILETDLPGPLTNVVTATATDRQGQPVPATDAQGVLLPLVNGQPAPTTATATVGLTYAATMTVTKAASARSAAVGDTVTYSFTVTNTGKVTINGLTMRDDKLGDITPAKNTLAPGESTTASVNHVIIEADLPSPLTNVVTVTGTDRVGQPVTATATATVDLTYTASLTMTKAASARSAKVGETVTYTYTITNTGKVTISALSLTDNRTGTVTLGQQSLAPGATITATATYTVAVEDYPGTVVNSAEIRGNDPAGRSITATAAVEITREDIIPELTCVATNPDGSFIAYFGYNNPNSYPVTIPVGNDNKITPPPDGQGQPTTFEPGRQTAVFGVTSPEHAVVWHLDRSNSDNANKNSNA
jgi:hypothetical protein